MPGCITIYTDASVCDRTKTGGWACWVKYAKFGTLQESGFFKEPCGDPTDAEMRAIANALHTVCKRLNPSDAILVVTTDSQSAIHYIEGKVKPRNAKHKFFAAYQRNTALAEKIRAMVPSDCLLRLKKVKAHCNNDGARSYCNDIVDKAAKAAMKNGRAAKLRGKSDD